MLYPQYFIDDLKARADLVRIIEPFVPLKKKGANYWGNCPFHQEKTASFSVSPSKGFYKCFGCDKGGNAFTFLMEMEGLSFPEAIKRVAEIAGVMLPEPVDDRTYQANKKKRDEKKKLADEVIGLNKIALEFWEKQLYENDPLAHAALKYLEKRGIDEEIIRKFRIGFAPDSWDALLSHLKQRGASEKLIEQSGLVSINEEKKSVYDRFRGRIVFPVLDAAGNPVAFGARIVKKGEPKYLNSPETPAYVKGEHLYGLFQSKDEIRRKKYAILVEGYLDLIALSQFGVKNCVASLGTALTDSQAKLLGRFARKVVVNYDGDEAGVKAAKRAIEILLAQDFEIKVLVLPDGQDPDDFIRANGFAAYKTQHETNAITYLKFVLREISKQYDISLPEHRQKAVEEVLPFVAVVQKLVQKRAIFDEAMNFLRVDESVKYDVWNKVKAGKHVDDKTFRRLLPKVTIAERRLLELLIFDKELRDRVLPQIEETDYEALATAGIFRAIFEIWKKGSKISGEKLLEFVDEDLLESDFVPILLAGGPSREKGEAIDDVLHDAENCIAALRGIAISRRIQEISQELVFAEQGGNVSLRDRLSAEQISLEIVKRKLERGIAAK